jgi:D-3-phosphoglycerate dehydrogenase
MTDTRNILGRPARILVMGDSFCPSVELRAAFSELAREHDVTFGDVVPDLSWTPRTPSEQRIREAEGTPEMVIAALEHHDMLVMQGAAVTDAVLDASPELRIVACARGGPVNVDVAAASERGVAVVITPGKNADAVAELTIGFMIMLGRRLPEVIRHVEGGGEFGHDNYEGRHWFGRDLAGHTLGLIGLGQVGRRVVARALPFGLRVLVYDPFLPAELIEATGAEVASLDELLDQSDYVSLHARQSADNRGMIGAAQLAHMKRGAYLINTARDSLVDEAAIVAALASGQLAGLAVDLVSPSPPPEAGRHPLLAFPNVIVTTHIGGATYETLHHGGEMAAAEISRYLAGAPMINLVNRAALEARETQPVATG